MGSLAGKLSEGVSAAARRRRSSVNQFFSANCATSKGPIELDDNAEEEQDAPALVAALKVASECYLGSN
jgi:hypothetical protein